MATHDDYMTPKYAWENIKHLIPNDKSIWEPFYGDGESGKDLTDLGFNVIHQDIDFFENDLGDIIVTNPPFSNIPKILERLVKLNKPFIMIMPTPKLTTQYFRKLFENKKIQIVIPRKRIQFKKLVNGEVPKDWKSQCAFDCFYYCWQMNFPNDIVWLHE